MTTALRYDSYSGPHGRQELLIGVGPAASTRTILIIPPLFEELNRLRRTLILTMRALGRRDIATALPDLPGQNESQTALENVMLDDWHDAVSAAARTAGATHVMSVRGGALIDTAPDLPVWRFAPANGKSLMNVLARAQVASDKQAGTPRSRDDYWRMAESEPILLGGKLFSPRLVSDLRAAEPARSDIAHEPQTVPGPPLWLRAEPGESAELADELAGALDTWSAGTRR